MRLCLDPAAAVRVLALVAWTVVACTSSSSNGTKTKGSSVADSTQTAIVYLQQAREMVAALAQAVVPGQPTPSASWGEGGLR